MKAFLYGFLLGAVCGAGAFWYFAPTVDSTDFEAAREELKRSADKVRDSIQEQMQKIDTETIKQELSRSGTIIRDKAREAGHAIAESAADAATTATIKARLAKDPIVSALDINVDSSGGLVVLSGKAKSQLEVGRAVQIALDTDGVRKVVSTIQVQEELPPPQ